MNIVPKNIDEYISGFPEDTRILLQQIRETIRKTVPEIEETISWGMPTFKQNGIVVQFAGYKKHIGLYPGPSGVEAFEKETSEFKTSKGTVQFPLNKPLPLDLITKIVKLRANENANKKRK